MRDLIVRAFDLHKVGFGPPTLVCIMWSDRYILMVNDAIEKAREMRPEFNGFDCED